MKLGKLHSPSQNNKWLKLGELHTYSQNNKCVKLRLLHTSTDITLYVRILGNFNINKGDNVKLGQFHTLYKMLNVCTTSKHWSVSIINISTCGSSILNVRLRNISQSSTF